MRFFRYLFSTYYILISDAYLKYNVQARAVSKTVWFDVSYKLYLTSILTEKPLPS